MPKMFLYYFLAGVLLALGGTAVAYQASSANLIALLWQGALPLAGGALAWSRARAVRGQVEMRHREQVLLDRIRRKGDVLELAEASRMLGVSLQETQSLLEDLARRGDLEIEAEESGRLIYRLPEQRLLGSGS